ncbi:MAG: hypothetical protein JNK76_26485 [Planctomycetales bacterium]|nr:hypothetical protein [Planctomycetales bacterium]
MKTLRPKNGLLVFYTRDSGGKHEMTPGEYVRMAAKRAAEGSLTFNGTPGAIEAMIRSGSYESGDLYLDYDVKGNLLSRPGLGALEKRIQTDKSVSHVFIPRRDRLARPDNPVDGMLLEIKLRSWGVTLVFLDKVVPPLEPGARDQIGDLIVSLIDYDKAGGDRRDLAEKILFAQLGLAAVGFSTGGRPPYAFRRWLAKVDGTKVRELQEGERVRMAEHHVVWLPVGDEHPHMQIVKRILEELPTKPACRIAAQLTAEGVPSPDAGRRRNDNGVEHEVSGAWHATTVTNIAINPLLLAVKSYGRRSMGDQLRFTPEGPRNMAHGDYRLDRKPKVIQNSDDATVKAAAGFDQLVDPEQHLGLLELLKERGGTQRGKPRSRDPNRNPLGGRVFDINCTWPMYRVPSGMKFHYTCGAYMQSHGALCTHNKVAGDELTRLVLDIARQKLLKPSAIEKLKIRLRELATADRPQDQAKLQISRKQAEIDQVKEQLTVVERNLAFAATDAQFKAVADVQADLLARQRALADELAALKSSVRDDGDVEQQVATALAGLDQLPQLVDDTQELSAIAKAFKTMNVRVFLGFKTVKLKKRTVNRVACGVVTFGEAEPPIQVYQGPTGRRAFRKEEKAAAVAVTPRGDKRLPGAKEADREDQSLGNVSRGDRTPIELFLASVANWENSKVPSLP